MTDFDVETIEKYLNGTCSKEEYDSVMKWLETEDGQRFSSDVMNLDVSSLMKGTEVKTDLPEKEKDVSTSKELFSFKKIVFVILSLVASVVTLFLLKPYFFPDFSDQKSYTEISVPKGEYQKIFLKDESVVWLSPNTHVRYVKEDFSRERVVCMEGEAYFDVKEIQHSSFLIKLSGLNVNTLGGSFNVVNVPDSGRVVITVYKGTLNVAAESNLKNNDDFRINPGDILEYSFPNKQFSIYKTPRYNILDAGRDGVH